MNSLSHEVTTEGSTSISKWPKWMVITLYLLLGIGVPLLAAGIALVHGMPQPLVHDEFSYLFMAETFSLGRLVNPEHPMSQFFQTFYIIHTDGIYVSKYFPGIGLQLLIGLIPGHPIFGVWLTIGLFGVSLFHVLRRLFSDATAAVISFLCGLQYMVLTYFGHSYWGGSLIALAGVWILGGAILRIRLSQSRYAWLSAAGIVLCLITRPFEGLFFVAPVAVWISGIIWKERKINAQSWHIAVPCVIGTLLGVLLVAGYNQRVTGKWNLFPHTLYEQKYTPHGVRFVWEKGSQKTDDSFFQTLPQPFHDLRELYKVEHEERTNNFGRKKLESASEIILFYLPLTFQWLLIATLLYRSHWRSPIWILSAVTVLMRLGPFAASWSSKQPHYGAMWIFPLAVLAAFGLESLRTGSKRTAQIAKIGTTLSFFGLLFFYVWNLNPTADLSWRRNWINDYGMKSRNNVVQFLNSDPSTQHLVFVKYGRAHNIHGEWVFNGPQIDKQKIVWAHDLGPANDIKLMRYYPSRAIWHVEVGGFATATLKRWNATNSKFETVTTFDE